MVSKTRLDAMLFEEESSSFGSGQMVRFAFGMLYAMNGHDIPEKCYPLPTTRYLAGVYAGTGAEPWLLALWGSHAMTHQHKRDLKAFGVEFDTWFSESSLLRPSERAMSRHLVINGANWKDRCSQCGRVKADASICAQCFELIVPELDLDCWCAFKGIGKDTGSIWDGYEAWAAANEKPHAD